MPSEPKPNGGLDLRRAYLPLGTVVAVVLLALTGAVKYFQHDQRLSLLEREAQLALAEVVKHEGEGWHSGMPQYVDRALDAKVGEILRRLDKIEQKLDRLTYQAYPPPNATTP